MFSVVAFAFPVHARSYAIPSFDVEMRIQEDSTVRVSETLSYEFDGEYHQGYRNVSHKNIGSISDITVRDAATGQELQYSFIKLDKINPTNWNKYTYSQGFGSTNIEWYHNGAQRRTWILEYTVHGALAFYKNHDELYWNLFTDYEVPIDLVTAKVILPYSVQDASNLQTSIYTTSRSGVTEIVGTDRATYLAEYAPAGADVTVAFGFPKGIVSRTAYWKDFFVSNILIWISLLLFFIGCTFPFAWRYVKERRGDIVVVPEYEPPKNIRPAMAELVVHEKLSQRTWPATIVDLAVRGYLTIREEKVRTPLKGIGTVLGGVLFVGLLVGLVSFGDERVGWFILFMGVFGIITVLQVIGSYGGVLKSFARTDYILSKIEQSDQSKLEDYEKEVLQMLFQDRLVFSTGDLIRASNEKKQDMALAFVRIKNETEEESEKDLHIFVHQPDAQRKGVIIMQIVIGILFYIVIDKLETFHLPIVLLGVSILVLACSMAYSIFFRKVLNATGSELRRRFLGFILYLETAEQYRMQNLTPETFEKYLPYAMVFGVEKKWARAFRGVTMAPPQWYQGSPTFAGGGGFSPSFSATAFTGAFSASFASSFSTSTGTGASGGGGGAGGGGGGGGGGAS